MGRRQLVSFYLTLIPSILTIKSMQSLLQLSSVSLFFMLAIPLYARIQREKLPEPLYVPWFKPVAGTHSELLFIRFLLRRSTEDPLWLITMNSYKNMAKRALLLSFACSNTICFCLVSVVLSLDNQTQWSIKFMWLEEWDKTISVLL